jgi:hypothetical protein
MFVPVLATIVVWIEGNMTRIALLKGIFDGIANCAPIIGYHSAERLKTKKKARVKKVRFT